MMANTDFANEIITLIIHQPVIICSNPVSTQISLESIMIELLKNIIPRSIRKSIGCNVIRRVFSTRLLI